MAAQCSRPCARRFSLLPARMIRLFVFSSCLCITATGQDRRSAISGVVRDPSGAVVAEAAVRVDNTATGETRETRTDERGAYRLAFLEPGNYQTTVSKTGFQAALKAGLTLEIGQETVVDFVLQVGAVSEAIEVTAEARTVGLSSSTLSTVIDGRTVRELPLNGRDYAQLATLDAGVPLARTQFRNANNGYGLQLSFAGSRPFQNSFLLDGVSINTYNGTIAGSVNGVNLGVDAIGEFAVMTSGFGAMYGRASGGVLHASTRSGSNEFHGGLTYLHRNDNLDARNFFDGADVPEFRRHQYSGYLGGPIRRNRMFFFANYEGLREARGGTEIDTTLSDNARTGLLSSGQISVDPSVAPVLNLYPRPNAEVLGDTGLFVFENDEVGSENFVTSRIDTDFGDADKLFFRFTFDNGARTDQTVYALGDRSNATRMYSAALEHTHAFSSGAVNTARLGFLRTHTTAGLTQTRNPATDSADLSFLPGGQSVGIIVVSGLSDFPGGTGAMDADIHAFNSYQASEDFSWSRGTHLIQAGARVERTQFNTNSQNGVSGEYQFRSVVDFLLNRPDRFRGQFEGSDTIRGHRQSILSGYVQDSWRAHSRLTVDLGLRYEWASVPTEVNGKVANLDDLTSPEMRVGDPLFNNPAGKNFAPRIGLAWRATASGSMLIRAGYGIYDDLILSEYLMLAGVRNPPFFVRGDVRKLAVGSFPKGGYEELLNRGSRDLRAERFPRDLGQPYVQQWNFSVEQALGESSLLRLSYSGSRGVHLSAITEDANLAVPEILPDGRQFYPEGGVRRNPNFSIIRNRSFDALSSYHGFQAQLRKRYSRGVQGQLGYSFSKSIDDSSGFFGPSEAINQIGVPAVGSPRINRGLSSQDVRHVLTGALLWDTPALKSRSLRNVAGDWTLGMIITAAAGQPFSVRMGYDSARTLTGRAGADSGQRPDLAPGADPNAATGDPLQWVDPSAFLRPEPGFLGNLGRNTVIGPGVFDLDFSAGKRFALRKLREGTTLDFRAEFFNLLNHTNFVMPDAARMELFTANGMREDFARITSAQESREIQFSSRLRF